MKFLIYLASFSSAFVISFCLTYFIEKISRKFNILDDRRSSPDRKLHNEPTPLLGGLAIFFAFFVILFLTFFLGWLERPLIPARIFIGIFFASFLLMAGGFLDDKYRLKPFWSVIFPVLASLIVILAGIGIEKINHPFGAFHLARPEFIEGLRTSPFGMQFIYLNYPIINLSLPSGQSFVFSPWSAIVIFIWLMVMMYSTKLLDGLDGLVSGLTGFGALILAFFCLFSIFYQPSIALISLILAGASFGFLFFNLHPAKIFLGEGGSLFCGFMLGLLAIIAGGKLALTFMIVGLAVIDLFWTIFRRIFLEHRSPFSADRGHLHFRLIRLFGYKRTVYVYWLTSILLGLAMFFLKTRGKIIAIAFFLIIVLAFLFYLEKNKRYCA